MSELTAATLVDATAEGAVEAGSPTALVASESGASDASAAETAAASSETPSARASRAQEDDWYEAFSCERDDVQCLTLAGEPLIPSKKYLEDAGVDPPLLKRPIPNSTLVINVIGDANASADAGALTCQAGGGTWTPPAYAPDGGTDAGARQRYLRAAMTVRVPDLPSFDVSCKEGDRERFRISMSIANDKPYHFEAVVLVPFVFGGDRTIYRAPLAGTEEQVLQHKDDLKIVAALGLHYFPLGIYGAGPWTGETQGVCANAVSPFRGACKYLLQPIGLEVGATIDLSSWYVGAAFEPIRGGALSIGVSALKGDFYQPGFRDGMIFATDGLPVDRRYMFRPYFGLSISPELLRFVANAFEQVRGLAPPGQSPPKASSP